ncbi:DUF773 domain-containing protein [Chloropicon primus]|uniref:DUF773 domain-containing protein n=1 Tax=Chloropicon primus TaxID=1764295 RepID=A0A5B8MU49_9CHLO|nr:DUF773 domain-containing protein [Chloropicon primus]UPR02496.1 DUF773 domain-containing protein [Chloropicon primus]|eukprot:QDZ23284.1 DUF773 domain-containing protein [Chloropicon primus]
MANEVESVGGGADPLVVGGGDHLLPIDLHYDKLIDWLVDRNKVPQDWRKRLKTLHNKLRHALDTTNHKEEDKELDGERRLAEEILVTLRGDLPDETVVPNGYHVLCELKSKLLEEGTTTAGIFGGPSGLAGDLHKLLKLYDRDGLSLVETAQFLVRATDYEIPSLQTKLDRIYAQVDDTERRQREYAKSMEACASNFRDACREWSVDPVDVEKGDDAALCKNLRGLPVELDKCVKEIKSGKVQDAIKYYRSFTEFVRDQVSSSGQGGEDDALKALDELLSGAREEMTLRLAYESVLPSDGRSASPDAAVAIVGLDDAPGNGESGEPTLSWDIGDAAAEEEEPTLSWDIDVTGGAEEGGEGEPTLSWDIDVGASGAGAIEAVNADATSSSSEEEEGLEGVVDGDVSKLCCHGFKQRILDDLWELSAFLGQRLAEGESQSGFWRDADSVDTKELLSSVGSIAGQLTCQEVERLDSLRNSRTREKIMRTLKQKQSQEGKYLEMIRAVEKRREGLQRESLGLRPKLKALVDHTKLLKRSVEQAISKQYDNRPVNVIGKINETLSSVL